jgi:DNA-binding LytR/AlgR family response regulator
MNHNKLHVLIVEDEEATANRHISMLQELHPGVMILAITDSISSTVAWLQSNPDPDLILMDIHLSDGSSFEIFQEVKVKAPVIFLTAYDAYALKAFKVNSIDYLLKPLKKKELKDALEKFEQWIHKPETIDYQRIAALLQHEPKSLLQRMMVKVGSQIKTFETTDVAYFYIDEKIVFAMLHSGDRYAVDYSLDQLDEQLDSSLFFRINRSMIIQFRAIEKMYMYSKSRIKILLKPASDGDAISSTDRSPAFRDWLNGR